MAKALIISAGYPAAKYRVSFTEKRGYTAIVLKRCTECFNCHWVVKRTIDSCYCDYYLDTSNKLKATRRWKTYWVKLV